MLFDATIAQKVLMDTDKQGSCSVFVLSNNTDICWHDFLWKMGTTGHNTKCDSSYDQPTLADWRHWTVLKEDDGGGPRLPHGEIVPPYERNCKLDLDELDLTLTYFHIYRISLSSLGEPTQTRSRGRRCLSWRKVQRRWRFPIGEWDKDNRFSSKLWYWQQHL